MQIYIVAGSQFPLTALKGTVRNNMELKGTKRHSREQKGADGGILS
ncbi:MAG: hypothetical protein WBC06_04080 [Chitinophagaceae bacterium]